MMSPADREEGARQALPPDVYAYSKHAELEAALHNVLL